MLFDMIFAVEAAEQAATAADMASLEAEARQGLNPELAEALGLRSGVVFDFE